MNFLFNLKNTNTNKMELLSISNTNPNKSQSFEEFIQLNNFEDEIMRPDSVSENKFDDNFID